MALTTRSTIKGFLNIASGDTTFDSWIDAIQPAAEAVIKKYCDRDFESATYTEFYRGENKNWFCLKQTPVTSITSIHLDRTGYYGKNPDGSFQTADLLVEGVDYVLDWKNASLSETGIVYRINEVWPYFNRETRSGSGTLSWIFTPSPGNIKVVYVAGYATIPQDIQMAVAMLVAEEQKSLPRGGTVFSERIGDYSYEMAGERMMGKLQAIGSLRQILSRYREVF